MEENQKAMTWASMVIQVPAFSSCSRFGEPWKGLFSGAEAIAGPDGLHL